MPLSVDHKPNVKQEKRRIEAAGGGVEVRTSKAGSQFRSAYRVNGSLALSRSIGDFCYKRRLDLPPEQQMVCSTPDIHVELRSPLDEFIVLACDGIWDVRSNEQVCAFVRGGLRNGTSIPQIIEALFDDCITKDPKATGGLGADNMICVIVCSDRNSCTDSGRASRGCFFWKSWICSRI